MPPDPLANDAIINSRIFAVTPAVLFGAISDPARLAVWWGPKGWTNLFHRCEFRPGGLWRFTMRSPDGAAYEMDNQFAEISRPERVVVRHFQAGHDFVLTMHFAPEDGGTRLTWHLRFDDPAVGRQLRDFTTGANEENFDRLEAHLAG